MAAINVKTLGRSAITSGLAQLWRIASRLILTPLIISSIGMEGYGVWTLVFSVAAYVQMTNASFGLAYTKFTAECVRHRRYDELSHIIGSGMTGVGSIAVLGLLLAWMFGEPVMTWLEVPEAMVSEALSLYRVHDTNEEHITGWVAGADSRETAEALLKSGQFTVLPTAALVGMRFSVVKTLSLPAGCTVKMQEHKSITCK